MELENSAKKKKGSSTLLLILVTVLIILAAGSGFIFFESEKPVITLDRTILYFGPKTPVTFTAVDSRRGLKKIRVELIQGEKKKTLYSTEFQRQGYWLKCGPESQTISYTDGIKKKGFKEGEARLIIEATDYSLFHFFTGNTSRLEQKVTIDTKPPRVNILHSERYIENGGAGFVIYRLSDDTDRHGVVLGNDFHPGTPIEDGREDVFNAIFAVPYSAKTLQNPHIIAVDKAGNQSIIPFSTRLKHKKYKNDRINVGDGFLQRKVPEFQDHYPEMKGNLLAKYLYTNNSVRKQNNKKIKEICSKSSPKRLWKDRFLRMSGSSKAGYADHRTYYYKNKAIDNQVHLGVDIASTKRSGVKAAGNGIVVFADYLGIYGNNVIVDHGMGLFSLYAHLSQINVAVEDTLEKGFILGMTGISGMAGGDHLHFSMLVNGIFVTPVEWWDQSWIDVTIQEPIIDSKF